MAPHLAVGVKVKHLMTAAPVVVGPDVSIEQAAALMRRRKVGGLPVVEGDRLAGIITESDLFDVFVDLFAVGPNEVRLHVPVVSLIVELPRLVAALTQAGVPIVALHTSRVHGADAVDVIVRDRDEPTARELIRALTVDADTERPLEHSKDG
jgi:acetoin utilization protein AcuB